MKTYLEIIIMGMVYEKVDYLQKIKIKEYMKNFGEKPLVGIWGRLVETDSIKEKIERYNLRSVGDENLLSFIQKVSLIEYHRIIGDFDVVEKMELELKALRRNMIIENILRN